MMKFWSKSSRIRLEYNKKGKQMADTLKKLQCPACGKEMEKVFIPSQGINLDICTQGCGGIYFDNRELNSFDEKNEDISKILEHISDKNFVDVNTALDRHCPNCGTKMVKNFSSINKEIEIDECYNCGGKFLDNSELQKLRAEYDTEEERSEDVVRHIYQQVGQELAQVDERYSRTITDRSICQKIFYKLLGL